MKKSFQKRLQPKLEGRGLLEAISTSGPHSDWLGMPDYYIHTLTVAGDNYKYLSPDKLLEVNIGDTVVFRYQKVGPTEKKENRIDKHSLGIYIDPSQYLQETP